MSHACRKEFRKKTSPPKVRGGKKKRKCALTGETGPELGASKRLLRSATDRRTKSLRSAFCSKENETVEPREEMQKGYLGVKCKLN